jgi:GntR family transcriptional repressor for pyruvate dehydrogenase complex
MSSSENLEPRELLATEQVVNHVRRLVESKSLRPGDRLPAERDLASEIGVSRPSARAGLRSLAAMGVLQSRHGAGTFIAEGPPVLGSEPLRFLAALHGFTRDQMFEARRVLELGVAGLAAKHATGEQLAAMAEEVTEMFASLDDPEIFLVQDIRFHRALAAASGNPILGALIEMVAALLYEHRRTTAALARNLRESVELHRKIHQAVRDRDPERARAAMSEHLLLAEASQAQETTSPPGNGDEAPAAGSAS